jgi:hypothetical protein
MNVAVVNMGWGVLFIILGGVVGMAVLLLAIGILPRMVDRLTPAIDEEKEIARGNTAVAEYFGRVVGACIIGVSVIVAAAVLAGIFAALH